IPAGQVCGVPDCPGAAPGSASGFGKTCPGGALGALDALGAVGALGAGRALASSEATSRGNPLLAGGVAAKAGRTSSAGSSGRPAQPSRQAPSSQAFEILVRVTRKRPFYTLGRCAQKYRRAARWPPAGSPFARLAHPAAGFDASSTTWGMIFFKPRTPMPFTRN